MCCFKLKKKKAHQVSLAEVSVLVHFTKNWVSYDFPNPFRNGLTVHKAQLDPSFAYELSHLLPACECHHNSSSAGSDLQFVLVSSSTYHVLFPFTELIFGWISPVHLFVYFFAVYFPSRECKRQEISDLKCWFTVTAPVSIPVTGAWLEFNKHL